MCVFTCMCYVLAKQVRAGAEKARGLEQELDELRKRPVAAALPDDVQKQLSELDLLQKKSALQAQVCVCVCVCVCVRA